MESLHLARSCLCSHADSADGTFANRLIDDARLIGYRQLKLESLEFLEAAHSLYRSIEFSEVEPEQPPLWGSLTAPAMIVHLCDHLHMALGNHICAPVPSVWRYPPFREAWLYILPWEKHIQGPPEAFLTGPSSWNQDLATLHELLEHFLTHEPSGAWPEHPNLGRMSRRAWGVFTYRHFDHHLRQFAV